MSQSRLRDKRRQAHMTQEELARKADISVFTVSNLENGRVPSFRIARKLADALGCEPGDLFEVTEVAS